MRALHEWRVIRPKRHVWGRKPTSRYEPAPDSVKSSDGRPQSSQVEKRRQPTVRRPGGPAGHSERDRIAGLGPIWITAPGKVTSVLFESCVQAKKRIGEREGPSASSAGPPFICPVGRRRSIPSNRARRRAFLAVVLVPFPRTRGQAQA
jgi:hypothetical protein